MRVEQHLVRLLVGRRHKIEQTLQDRNRPASIDRKCMPLINKRLKARVLHNRGCRGLLALCVRRFLVAGRELALLLLVQDRVDVRLAEIGPQHIVVRLGRNGSAALLCLDQELNGLCRAMSWPTVQGSADPYAGPCSRA